nr:PREDICTED: NFX1-type zinc finger-containing protein 1-like [Bemisia tabaci]
MFLEHIKAPDLQTIQDGKAVQEIIAKLMEAPLTWKSLVKAAHDRALNERALGVFAWLLVQLLSLPSKDATQYLTVAQDPFIQKVLLESSSYDIKSQGELIKQIADKIAGSSGSEELVLGITQRDPGGRHDNDFPEIHRISIYPTPDELKATARYLPRPCDAEDRAQESDALASHIDCQFRLLREDMLCELREDLAAVTQLKNRGRKPLEILNLELEGVYCDRRLPWSVQLHCTKGLPQLRGLRSNQRKNYFKSKQNFLRTGTFVCLCVGHEFVTLGTLFRDEELLMESVLCVQLPAKNLKSVLVQLKDARSNIRLVLINSAIFAYEPVLKQLQNITVLSLSQEIISWRVGTAILPPEYSLGSLSTRLKRRSESLECNDNSANPLPSIRLRGSNVSLDEAQTKCFLAALLQKVALIQGPPGTGKSFIGALIGKTIYQYSTETILVVCYTHHALDDFVKDLLQLGIPKCDIVRLGSSQKATPITKPLALREQKAFLSHSQRDLVRDLKCLLANKEKSLEIAFNQFAAFRFSYQDVLHFLKWEEEYLKFYNAFKVSEEEDGMIRVAEGGNTVQYDYLLHRWIRGMDAGIYRYSVVDKYRAIWDMSIELRRKTWQQWNYEMSKERAALVRDAGNSYNHIIKDLDYLFLQRDLSVMRSKRIIACTTTAAAKYSEALSRISAGVVLVEEAGEILESHVLTALGPSTKHLILIGDHKQLRPRVSYELSVEKGTGYDLNRSLFERLILKGFPHHTLFTQHRMRPEISSLIRKMTYSELKDADNTLNRPNLRGFLDNIIFVNHKEPETELSVAREFGDSKAATSKQNRFEAHMTLKCVRYLGQQGYTTEDIVVLTPYLGQLRLLLDELSVDHSLQLNDLDAYDLARAGLTREREDTEDAEKPRLRVSTIDNFQGEEANIVVASLTRSNATGDVGFMSAPERLNVLVSRARNALILIGNAEHFMGSRKGSDLWTRFIGLLKDGMHVYNGFPIRCERHPDRTSIIQKPADFDTESPAGGCKEPCGKMLHCGDHKCPSTCHSSSDHRKLKCKVLIQAECIEGHAYTAECHETRMSDEFRRTFGFEGNCPMCKSEDKATREEARRKHDTKEEKEKHSLKMVELDREIEQIMKNSLKTIKLELDRNIEPTENLLSTCDKAGEEDEVTALDSNNKT